MKRFQSPIVCRRKFPSPAVHRQRQLEHVLVDSLRFSSSQRSQNGSPAVVLPLPLEPAPHIADEAPAGYRPNTADPKHEEECVLQWFERVGHNARW